MGLKFEAISRFFDQRRERERWRRRIGAKKRPSTGGALEVVT